MLARQKWRAIFVPFCLTGISVAGKMARMVNQVYSNREPIMNIERSPAWIRPDGLYLPPVWIVDSYTEQDEKGTYWPLAMSPPVVPQGADSPNQIFYKLYADMDRVPGPSGWDAWTIGHIEELDGDLVPHWPIAISPPICPSFRP